MVLAPARRRGLLTSKDGTFGTSGTGLYYEIDAVRDSADTAQRDFPLHDQHGGARLDQIPLYRRSTTAARRESDRRPLPANRRIRVGSGGTQNTMNNIPGMCDGTDHDITLVFDRNERKCYVFADGVLFETKCWRAPAQPTPAQVCDSEATLATAPAMRNSPTPTWVRG